MSAPTRQVINNITYYDPMQLLLHVFAQRYPDVKVSVAYAQLPPQHNGVCQMTDDGEFRIFIDPCQVTIAEAPQILAHELAHVVECLWRITPEGIDKTPGDEYSHSPEWEKAFSELSVAYNAVLETVQQPDAQVEMPPNSPKQVVLQSSPPPTPFPTMLMQHENGEQYCGAAVAKGAGSLRGEDFFVYEGAVGNFYVRSMSAWEEERHKFKLVIEVEDDGV